MGWTHCYNATNWKTAGGREVVDRKAECDKMLTWEQRDERWNVVRTNRVLKSAMVGSTYYAAVESRQPQKGKRHVWAAVFLTCGQTKWDHTVWGYKDMDETEGPYYYDCPASILDLLTPTDSKSANEWRETCRKNLAEKKVRRAKGSEPIYVPTGMSIREERGSWYVSIGYITRRGSKRAWHDGNRLVVAMIERFGSDKTKAEYAASGHECPKEWKEVAA